MININKKISFIQIVLYGVVSFLSNVASTYPLYYFLVFLLEVCGRNLFVNVLAYIAYLVIPLIVSWACILLFFKIQHVSSHYAPNAPKRYWMKSCAFLVMPAEILRFVISLISLGHVNKTGNLAKFVSFLFEETYLRFSGRMQPVRYELTYITLDYIMYILCYFLYAAIYFLGIFWMYRRCWKKGAIEKEELIVHDTY